MVWGCRVAAPPASRCELPAVNRPPQRVGVAVVPRRHVLVRGGWGVWCSLPTRARLRHAWIQNPATAPRVASTPTTHALRPRDVLARPSPNSRPWRAPRSC
eukprot:scaffold4382_cov90-Isochrysis_galbana.AAC.2